MPDLKHYDYRSSKAPEPTPGSGGKDEAGSEEELDLLDFLGEKPYYVPSDRAAEAGAK